MELILCRGEFLKPLGQRIVFKRYYCPTLSDSDGTRESGARRRAQKIVQNKNMEDIITVKAENQ